MNHYGKTITRLPPEDTVMHTILNEELCPPINSSIVEIQPPIQSIITLEYKGPTSRKGSRLTLRWGCDKVSFPVSNDTGIVQQAINYLSTRSIVVTNDLFLPENFVQKHCKSLGNVWLLIVEYNPEATLS
jgi:hypothetical protein